MMAKVVEERYPWGWLLSRKYYLGRLLHRDDGPALEYFHPNGTLWCQAWYSHGLLHRIDGPAVFWFHPDGAIADESHWLNDSFVTYDEYCQLVGAHHSEK